MITDHQVTWKNNTASPFLSLLYPHRRLTLYKSQYTIMGKEYFVFVWRVYSALPPSQQINYSYYRSRGKTTLRLRFWVCSLPPLPLQWIKTVLRTNHRTRQWQNPNSKHRFPHPSRLGGRCRKAMLGVWDWLMLFNSKFETLCQHLPILYSSCVLVSECERRARVTCPRYAHNTIAETVSSD